MPPAERRRRGGYAPAAPDAAVSGVTEKIVWNW